MFWESLVSAEPRFCQPNHKGRALDPAPAEKATSRTQAGIGNIPFPTTSMKDEISPGMVPLFWSTTPEQFERDTLVSTFDIRIYEINSILQYVKALRKISYDRLPVPSGSVNAVSLGGGKLSWLFTQEVQPVLWDIEVWHFRIWMKSYACSKWIYRLLWPFVPLLPGLEEAPNTVCPQPRYPLLREEIMVVYASLNVTVQFSTTRTKYRNGRRKYHNSLSKPSKGMSASRNLPLSEFIIPILYIPLKGMCCT